MNDEVVRRAMSEPYDMDSDEQYQRAKEALSHLEDELGGSQVERRYWPYIESYIGILRASIRHYEERIQQ